MHWNYRVIRSQQDRDAEAVYAIHECYYETPGDKIPTSWTEQPADLLSETRSGLLLVMSKMAGAVGKPVLEERDGKLVEVEPMQELSDDPWEGAPRGGTNGSE